MVNSSIHSMIQPNLQKKTDDLFEVFLQHRMEAFGPF